MHWFKFKSKVLLLPKFILLTAVLSSLEFSFEVDEREMINPMTDSEMELIKSKFYNTIIVL